jgi:hypothetical protein
MWLSHGRRLFYFSGALPTLVGDNVDGGAALTSGDRPSGWRVFAHATE